MCYNLIECVCLTAVYYWMVLAVDVTGDLKSETDISDWVGLWMILDWLMCDELRLKLYICLVIHQKWQHCFPFSVVGSISYSLGHLRALPTETIKWHKLDRHTANHLSQSSISHPLQRDHTVIQLHRSNTIPELHHDITNAELQLDPLARLQHDGLDNKHDNHALQSQYYYSFTQPWHDYHTLQP